MPPEELRKAPFLRLIFPIVGGILLGRIMQCPDWVGWVCIGCSAGFILVSVLNQRKDNTPLLMCFFIMGIVLGREPGIPHIPEGMFSARVCDDVVSTGKGARTLVDRIHYMDQDSWVRVRGKASIYLAGLSEPDDQAETRLFPGARLIARGKLSTYEPPMNPCQFDYGTFQKGRGIFFQAYLDSSSWKPAGGEIAYGLKIRSVLLRRRLIERLESQISGKAQQAILSALLLGYRDEMDTVLKQNFARSGTMHILAVSGLHVGIIYLLPAVLLRRMRNYLYAVIPVGIMVFTGLWFYAFLTGLSVSVVRAVTMCCIHGIAMVSRRKVSTLHVISLAAFVIILARPAAVFEAGFQLSFAAVTGITFLYRRFLSVFHLPGWFGRRISQMISVSLAAQLSTFPLAIFYFNMFAPASVLANLVVIPLATLILYAGFGFFLITDTIPAAENLSSLCPGSNQAAESMSPVIFSSIQSAETVAPVSQILVSLLDGLSSFLEWFTSSIAGMKGIYAGGLSLITSQVVLLYVCGGLALNCIRRRSARSLFLLMSAVILFLVVSGVREYRIQTHVKMYVFALRDETTIAFVHGRQSVLFRGFDPYMQASGKDLPPDQSALFTSSYEDLPYEIEPFFNRYKLFRPGHFAEGNPARADYDTHTVNLSSGETVATSFLWHGEICSPGMEGIYIDFTGKRILILRKLDELYSRQIPPLAVDVIILCNNPEINLSGFVNKIDVKQVVADGSNHPWYVKKIESACREAGMVFHSTRTGACFSF